MMSVTPNSHDSQYKMQNGLMKKDEEYVRITKDTVKGDTLSPEQRDGTNCDRHET